jgi:hypothetical protein
MNYKRRRQHYLSAGEWNKIDFNVKQGDALMAQETFDHFFTLGFLFIFPVLFVEE